MSNRSDPLVLRPFTHGWMQYALALSYVPIAALDWAGFWVPLPAAWHFLALIGLVLLQVAFLLWRWRHSRWSALAPLAALILALSFGHRAGSRLGNQLLRHRFEANRSAYNVVADQVLGGAYPKTLRPEHQHLGYWARAVSNGDARDTVGVAFLVVSHGFAGHVGFIRIADPSAADRLLRSPPPGGWTTWLEPLEGSWYLVAN